MLKTVQTKNGKELNYLDGKLISKARAEELKTTTKDSAETIDVPNTTVTTIDKPQAVSKVCLFCGEEATHTKFVHLQIVQLCGPDYYNKTTGEIGEQLTHGDR